MPDVNMHCKGTTTWVSMRKSVVVCLLSFVLLGGCAISAKHPALRGAELPELVPVRDYVANTDYNGGYRISPDGQKIAGNGVKHLSSAILWRMRESEK